MTAGAVVREVFYRTAAPAGGVVPGHHRSRRGDGGFEFRGHARLRDVPDARRLDLRASLRDPFGEWQVRLSSERRAIPVVVVADLSASMGFDGSARRIDVLADLVDSIGWSAWRTGDAFGFVGCDAAVRNDWLQLPSRRRGTAQQLAQSLRVWRPEGPSSRSADGLLQAADFVGRQRALVFLVSDFHVPLPLLQRVLEGLARHEVVPVVLWDAAEFAPGARSGLLHAVDPETGRRRLVWWRPALRERWQRARAGRRDALAAVFAAQRLRPLVLEGGYDADAVTRHFHG